jgi:phosphoglycerate dehydrogenase-like enzyme
MLAQARSLPGTLGFRDSSKSNAWHFMRSQCSILQHQNAVILGYGAIAERLLRLLAPFDMKLSAYRRQARGDELLPILRPGDLPAALAQADHVINILPDNQETRHFFNPARFAQIRPGAVFYNIGRGTTVDQTALAENLGPGRLAAAWLDVTEPEPLPDDHPLWAMENCYITPHTAGGHHNESETVVRHFLDNFQRFLAGQPLLNRII